MDKDNHVSPLPMIMVSQSDPGIDGEPLTPANGVVMDSGANFDNVPSDLFVRRGIKRKDTRSLTGISVQEFNELGDCLQQDRSVQVASLCKLVTDTHCVVTFSKEGVVLKDKDGKMIPVSIINNIPQLSRRRYAELILPSLIAKAGNSEAAKQKVLALRKYVMAGEWPVTEDDPVCHVSEKLSDPEWRKHCATHIPAVAGCEVCNAASNMGERHYKSKQQEKPKGALSLDISGPHKEGLGRYRYILIAVYRPKKGVTNAFPFVRSLRTRMAQEVVDAVESIILQIGQIWLDGKPVLRVHSDAASEFLSKLMDDLSRKMGFWQTHTGGYNPQSNGLAERYVGLVKQTARALLLQANMSARAWPHACSTAAAVLRQKQGSTEAKLKFQFGSPIQYRTGDDHEGPFESQRQDGWYLGKNIKVKTGGWVWTGSKVRHSNNIRNKVLVKSDLPDKPIGLSMEGPLNDINDILESQDTQEEDTMCPVYDDIDAGEPRWFDDADEDCMIVDPMSHATNKPSRVTPIDNLGSGAPSLFTAGEPTEEATATLVGNKDVMLSQGSVRHEWIEAAMKELQSIVDLDVFETHTNDSLQPILKEFKNDGVMPEFLPSSVVWNIKPAKPPEFRKRYKARLCVAGNMSKVFGDSYTPTLDSCFAKIIVKLAVAHKWTLAVTDIKTAFLHAPLPENRCVIVRPPAGMVKLGLVDKDSLWRLRKALYGLRECPRLWAQERDSKMKHMNWTANIDEKDVSISMIHNILDPTLWSIVDSATGLSLGMVATYVDDVLFAGPVSVVTNGLVALNNIWKCDDPVFLNPGEHSEAVYLGIQMTRTTDGGVTLSQDKYTEQFLTKMNMMQCRAVGTTGESGWLTHPPDVTRLPDATLKMCQEALGGLLWLSTRTRMDIAYAVSMAASRAAKCPKTAWYMISRIMKYLSTNRALAIRMDADDKPLHLRCFTDASWAPANERSQSGIVICMNETPVIWKSSKQQLTALSSAEAELIALTHGFQYAMGVEAVMACSGMILKVTMYTDNTPAIATVIDSKFKWRSRYYSVRAARMREVLNAKEFNLEYIQGSNQVADILTKYTNRLTIIHCLKLTNHRQLMDGEWETLDEKLLKNRALNTGNFVKYPKELEYEATEGPMVPTLFDDGSRPTSLNMTKLARTKRWPDSRPTSEDDHMCWRAGPFGIWTPPKNPGDELWIRIPGHGLGKWGVNEHGKWGVSATNPTGTNGEWVDRVLPRCPYCGKAKSGSLNHNDTCECEVMENGKRFKEKLPFWKQGTRIVQKIRVKDLENFDYANEFPAK